jgi:hypothetical protein
MTSAISGPVTQNFTEFEALVTEAAIAFDDPNKPGRVSTIPDGYKWCETDGTSCESLTGFRSDTQGRITNFAVNGHLISTQLAIGASSNGLQIAISDVIAWQATPDEMLVVYKARSITSHDMGPGNPVFLPIFNPSTGGQLPEDSSESILPGNLKPGESAIEYTAFDTRTVTGRFSLRSNNAANYMAVLAATTLRLV